MHCTFVLASKTGGINEKDRNIRGFIHVLVSDSYIQLPTCKKKEQQPPTVQTQKKWISCEMAISAPISAPHLSSATNGAQAAQNVGDLGHRREMGCHVDVPGAWCPQMAIEVGTMISLAIGFKATQFSDKPMTWMIWGYPLFRKPLVSWEVGKLLHFLVLFLGGIRVKQ